MILLSRLALLASLLLAPVAALAQDEVSAGALTLSGGFSRATLPNAPVAGGYITITNAGPEPDRLVSVASPVAGVAQLHEMKMDGGMMKMAELPGGIEIPAGATVELKPGGLHMMFMSLNEGLVEGSTVPVTLTFEKAGPVDVKLTVGARDASAAPAHNH